MGGPWILIDDANGGVDYDGDWDLKVKDSNMMLGTFSTCHLPVDEGAAQADKPSILLSSLTGKHRRLLFLYGPYTKWRCCLELLGSQIDIYGRIANGTMLNATVDSGQSQPLQLLASGNGTAKVK